MSRLSAIFLVLVVTSHACMGVILRPSWFPYFRRPNQTAQRLRYPSSEKNPEVFDLRQTRSEAGSSRGSEAFSLDSLNKNNSVKDVSENPCKNGISLIGCLIRVLNIVNRAIEQQGLTT